MRLQREQDVILIGDRQSKPVTLWLPFYNGENFVRDRICEALDQEFTDYALVICDNASVDDTWMQVQSFRNELPPGTLLLRNAINVGFSGSISLNKHFIDSQWIAFMHQDDSYSITHLNTLIHKAQDSDEDVVAVSTEMGRLDPKAGRISIASRASMFPHTCDRAGHFLRNVATQSIPWPSTLFRVDAYMQTIAPWFTEAFGDVEQSLMLLLKGRHITIPSITMGYRENENSSSHTTTSAELLRATTLGLLRVFHSQSFQEFVKSLPDDQRVSFYENLRDAVIYRTKSMTTQELILSALDDQLCLAWENAVPQVLENMKSSFSTIQALRPQKILDSLIDMSVPSNLHLTRSTNDVILQLSETVFVKSPKKSPSSQVFTGILITLDRFLPRSMTRYILKSLIHLRVWLVRNHPWDFRWR